MLTMWAAAISQRFRRKRLQRFVRELEVNSETRILDVGGTSGFWQPLSVHPRITLLNMPWEKSGPSSVSAFVIGDGRELPFGDQSFDIVFSNSVIEHVGSAADQSRFAHEVSRVGRHYWVQTPNRWFPIEQHLLTPLIHWLPKSWQKVLVPRWTVWGTLMSISADQRQYFPIHYLEGVRLLDSRDLRVLFPGGRLIKERICGVTKSLVAVR